MKFKRLAFILASAFFAAMGYCANLTDKVLNTSDISADTNIEKRQNQPLILEKAADFLKNSVSWHYSHSSHYSHGSHGSHSSHSSHSSHYSGW